MALSDLSSQHQYVKDVLDNAEMYDWTTMGFGMVRTYLDDRHKWRLNVWHSKLRVPNVSTIHDHPWSFTSYIHAGELKNTIYDIERRGLPPTHLFQHIKTGEQGGPVSEPTPLTLRARPSTFHFPGDRYTQRLDIIHETDYRDGTVTLNDRTPPTKEHTARVFFPIGTAWVDAKPRAATDKEVAMAVKEALKLW